MKQAKITFFLLFISVCLSIAFSASANDQKQVSELGYMLVDAIKSENYTKIDKRFDKQAFTEIIVQSMKLSQKDNNIVRKQALTLDLQTILGNGLAGVDKSDLKVKMIGVVRENDRAIPVVRINMGDGGSNYYELILKKVNNTYYIEDIFLASNSQYISATLAQAFAMTLNLPAGLAAIFSDNSISLEDMAGTMTEVVAHKRKGDFKSAYNTLQTLPGMKNKDIVQLLIVLVSAQVNETIYSKELSRFAKNHGKNPRYSFLLIDYYYYNKQYDVAIDSINTLLNRYQNDASLLTLKANIYSEKKEYAMAITAAKSAIDAEPDYEDAYWSNVTIALAEDNYSSAIDWLDQLEIQFNYDFDEEDFINNDVYSKLILSEEFSNWMDGIST
jgi:tetratricopeptide (TPR) repeat protein